MEIMKAHHDGRYYGLIMTVSTARSCNAERANGKRNDAVLGHCCRPLLSDGTVRQLPVIVMTSMHRFTFYNYQIISHRFI